MAGASTSAGRARATWARCESAVVDSSVVNFADILSLPLEFTRRLHAEATLLGLKTVIGTPLARNAASKTIITDVGSYHYDKLIITAGPWSAELCRTLAIPPVPVGTLPGHSVLLRPLMPEAYKGILPAEAILAGLGATSNDLGHGPGHSARVDHSQVDPTDPAAGPYGLTKNIEFYPCVLRFHWVVQY